MLSNQPILLSDMYSYDSGVRNKLIKVYTSLKYILDNPISEDDLISFTTRLKDPFTNK